MLPKIVSVRPEKDYMLSVIFADGRNCLYDVKRDIDSVESYRDLIDIEGLFNQVQIDESKTCIFWNDYIDLPSDTIYEYGEEVRNGREKED